MMTNKLEMPLEQFAEAVAKENERLTSGPGGIMEMKQTIADKEQRIEKLESQFKLYFHAFNKAANHIEKLEAALKNISEGDIPRKVKIPFRDDGQSSKHDRCEHGQWFYEDCGCCIEDYARKALEGKEPLEWTENHGQGSEPWLNKE